MISIPKLQQELDSLQFNARLRRLHTQKGMVCHSSFCSNDYLGLKNDSRLVHAAQKALKDWGVGTGSAHLIEGHTQVHHALEEKLADFVGAEKALLFSTGYMANLAVLTTFAEKEDVIVMDKLNHASLIDGAQLSRASMVRYAHNDLTALARRLAKIKSGCGMIVSDSVFSMDGDVAPIQGLIEQARTGEHALFLDEAHGIGVMGPEGRGAYAQAGEALGEQFLLMGTFGKALGTAGAFVAGQRDVIDYLINKARPFIYTTAMPASLAAATLTSLSIIESDEGDDLRTQLATNIAQFRSGALSLGWDLMESETAIQPILVGREDVAVALSERLAEQGFRVPAIRPPTVPEGQSRLRVTLTAQHNSEQIEQFLDALGVCGE